MSIDVRTVRIRSALVLLVLVAGLILPTGIAVAQHPLTPLQPLKPGMGRIQPGLVARTRSQGSVRVIVNLRTNVPEQGFRTRTARDSFASALKARATRLSKVARATGGAFVRRYRYLPSVVMYATPRTIERLQARSDVASVTEDRLYRPDMTWNVPLVQANTMDHAGYGGAGQIVAVLDSGVDATHPMLAGKVLRADEACFASGASAVDGVPGSPLVDGDCPNGKQVQFGDGAADPCTWADECVHGTHVAGIAAGRYIREGPAKTSISGVARRASVLPVQVFSSFDDPTDGPYIGAWDSDMAAGLEYVYQYALDHPMRHLAAVNLSIGGDPVSSTCDSDPSELSFKTAVNLLRTIGIATVVAAGNDYRTGYTSHPACLTAVITVSSTTQQDRFSDFSDIAPWVDVAAPGSGILSSVPGGYARLSGTSMAAPHVAGAWAELKSRFPNASFGVVRQALRATGVVVRDAWSGIWTRRIRTLDAGDWLGATSVSLTRSSALVASGSTVSFRLTVTRSQAAGSDPTGRLVLKVAGHKVASVAIDPSTGTDATAVVTINTKITGKHGARVGIQAFYKGDGRFVASRSPVVRVTIQ